MNKTVFYIVFCWLSMPLLAQTVPESENLVPNGSFEEYEWCPEYLNGNGVTELGSIGWLVPTNGSPDYFNSCSTEEAGVPQNFLGFQYARTGEAYAGLGLFDENTDYREYISIKLKESLIKNKLYYACFYVSSCKNTIYVSNNIGIGLSENFISNNTEELLEVDVYGNHSEIINRHDWTLISFSFKANGNENFLYIGNFLLNSQIELQVVNPNGYVGPASYYYIDDVYLGRIPCIDQKVHIPNVFTPNNDGINDSYRIETKGINDAQIDILNRWGQLVFRGSIDDEWDGTCNGSICVAGIYFVKVQYFDYQENKEVNKTGFIHLIR